jgi:hypothetical protein
MMRTLCRYALLLCLSLISVHLHAQNSAITGEVQDSQGAVIRGAEIRIVEQSQGTTRTVHSNETGSYNAPFLNPGPYRIYVQAPAFSTAVSDPVALTVGQTLVFNVRLRVGATQQEISVDAGSQLLNTTDASVGMVIDQKFVENIPLNGRSFQDLISMTPGVVTQSPQAGSSIGYNGDFSVNGQRTESNYYLVDGVSANIGAGNGYGSTQAANSGSIAATTALGTTQSLISVDALQEFRVESSTYSAEYGRTPGGQFSLVTRSGSNQLHGSAYDYLRNDFFDANDWFNDLYHDPKTALRQNDFGGTFGGPIMIPKLYRGQNRSFFFFSYEGLRLTQPHAATIQYVPDTSLRNHTSALQPIMNAFPLPTPNGIDYGNVAQFIQSYSLPSQIDSTSARVDHVLSSKLSIFFRMGDTPSESATRNLASLTELHLNTQSYTFGATSQFSTTVANEFRFGYARSNSLVNSTLDSFGGAVPINLANTMGLGAYSPPLAEVNLYIPGVGQALISTQGGSNKGRQWNLIDTFSLVRGSHQMKFGIDFRRIESPLTPPAVAGAAIFESATSVLTDTANVLSVYKYRDATPIFKEFAAFAQDEWHLSSRLNLSVGLRWEVNPPPTEAHGDDAYTLFGNVNDPSSLELAPQGTPLWKTTHFNFAPRVGVAWQAHNTPGWETVVRTGGGVFFDTDNEYATLGYTGLGFSANTLFFAAPIPVTATQLSFSPSATAPYTGSTVYAFPNHLQLPYTLQWNVSVQQALKKRQAITISYVASNGRRLLQDQTRSVESVNPEFSSITYLATDVTSNYQSLQAQFQRTITHGFQALASYTWSHSLDYGSTASELTLTRGNSDFDLRHNLQGGLSWDIPSTRRGGVWAAVANDWGLDTRVMARTSFPITLEGNYLTDPSTGREYYTNVDIVAGQPIYVYGSQYPGGRSLNPNAFVYPNGNDPGDAPRNFARGFGALQINLAARREFHLYEKLRLQFRAEAFNLPNRPNFGYVDPYVGDALFGQATQTLNQSLGTMASQYQQGGPRSMQFALKLLF